MVTRVWRGWTRPGDASAYERLLQSEILPGIAAKRLPGYLGAEVMRSDTGHEVEFLTILRFATMEGVLALAGPDPEVAFVPPAARALLARFDERVRHYESRVPMGEGSAGGRPYVLEEMSLCQSRDVGWEVAVLPWGATEPHNLHLPFGTDSIQVRHVAMESARLAWNAGAKTVVLPTVPMGANLQQLDTPLTLNLNPSTQALVLRDVVRSLEHQQIPKLMVLNGHGGNDFRQMIRELQGDTEVFICTANWYTVVSSTQYFDEPGDHAGELETSVMLHVSPGLVHPLSVAGPGAAKTFRARGFREGWAWVPRDWAQVSQDTGVGNPAAATSEKGSRFLGAVTKKLGEFLCDLAASDPQDLYE